MASSSRGDGSSLPPGDLPKRIFAPDYYPSHVVRINSYSRPRYLINIMDVLAGTSELEKILCSPLGLLFSLPVRQCALSGQLVHQMMCRQLHTYQLKELWFVFPGQPLKFSLVEFEEVIGLHYSAFPTTDEIKAATTHGKGKSTYWYKLIGGKLGGSTVDNIVEELKSEPNMPSWRKFCLTIIVLVEGVLLCRSQPLKPSIEVVKMSKNIDFFLNYRWCRHSFKRMVRMVKVRDYLPDKGVIINKLKQSSLDVHGFPLSLQLYSLTISYFIVGFNINQ